jgi:predicted transcriptional regulator
MQATQQGKTISQIANEIGVSKTAVRKHMTDGFRKQFAQTVCGTIFIDEQGATLIKSMFTKNEAETYHKPVSANQPQTVCGVSANQNDEVSDMVSTLVSTLQKELETKNQQLEAKDRQINQLTETIRIQAESINTDRKKELAGTMIDGAKLIGDGKPKGFKSAFRRFFGGDGER